MPDLTGPANTFARLMDDIARIDRDPDGNTTDDVDPVTGERVPALDNASEVYTGPCTFRMADQSRADAESEGGFDSYERGYIFKFPLDCPEIMSGDVITVLESRRHPDSVGKKFNVRVPKLGTFQISNQCITELDIRYSPFSEV